jgi:hypothetical protein
VTEPNVDTKPPQPTPKETFSRGEGKDGPAGVQALGVKDLNHAVIAGVTLLTAPAEGGKLDWIGTGFFFRNQAHKFVVTCRHVLEPPHGSPHDSVTLLTRTGPEFPAAGRNVALEVRRGGVRRFRTFVDASIDLAAIPITENELEGSWTFAFEGIHFPPRDIYLPIGSDVVVPGFPLGFYDDQNLMPVALRGSVASLYPIPFRGTQRFQIYGRLYEGMSGAPVFTRPDNFVYRYGQPFTFLGGPVAYLLGVHSEGRDGLQMQDVWYAQLLDSLTDPTPPADGPLKIE